MIYDLVIRSGTLVTHTGISQGDIGIQGEKIAAIGPHLSGKDEISALGMLVLPGGVDLHVHLEMPTSTTVTSETWETGSKAAAYGGTTTVIDFVEPGYPGQPLMEAFSARMEQAIRKSAIDFCFHMTLCSADADTLRQIPEVIAGGMPTFKVYTTYPDFLLKDEELLAVFETVRKARGLTLVHAELDAIIQHAVSRLLQTGCVGVRYFPESRPAIAEEEAVERVIRFATYTSAPVYIVHVSSQLGVEAIARARKKKLAVWGETCPQYLLLDEACIKTTDFNGAKFVCSPPLRNPQDQKALWSALHEGILQTVGTDHCAFNFVGQKDLGKNSFPEIPSGLPGIESRLALLYTYGVKTGKITHQQWVDLCCASPARLFGLYPRKGALAPGSDADIMIFDPNHTGKITHSGLHENVDYSPYEGMVSEGKVWATLLRGKVLVMDGKWVGDRNDGIFIPGVATQPG